MLSNETVEMLSRMADRLHAAGIFPAEVSTADKAFAIILAGHEMGFQPMQAARSIALVKGKVSLSADATIAVCTRSEVCEYFRLVESSATQAVYVTQRRGHPSPVELSYTFEQAKTAGLTGSGTWRAHPQAMLRARCGAALARAVYPDLVAGVYDPDEADEISRNDRGGPKASTKKPEPAGEEPKRDPETPEIPPALAAFHAALPGLASPDAGTGICVTHRAVLAAAAEPDRKAAIAALARRLTKFGGGVATVDAAKGFIKRTLAEHDARVQAAAAAQAAASASVAPPAVATAPEVAPLATEAPAPVPDPEPVAVPFGEQLARCTTLDGVAGLWIAAREDIAQGTQADQAAAWGAAVDRLAVIQRCAPSKSLGALLSKRIKILTGEEPDPNGPKGTPSRDATTPVDAHGHGEHANDGAGATMSTADRWRAHLAAKPRTGKHAGAGAVAASWVKHRDELTEAGARAECLAITIDELFARGVTEPGAWIDGVREHRVAKAA